MNKKDHCFYSFRVYNSKGFSYGSHVVVGDVAWSVDDACDHLKSLLEGKLKRLNRDSFCRVDVELPHVVKVVDLDKDEVVAKYKYDDVLFDAANTPMPWN